MSFSRAHLFPEEDQNTAFLAKAIAHPARIGIIRLIASHQAVELRFLITHLPLAAPTIQQHLHHLVRRQIVVIDQRPKRALYALNRQRLSGIHMMIDTCFHRLQSDLPGL